MGMQDRMIRGQITAAIRAMGGKEYDIIRQPRDANGQPSGAPAAVGRLFGLAYEKPSDSYNLHIALPGVITSDNNGPTMTALLLCGEEPQEKDTVSAGGKQTEIIKAYKTGPAWMLAIKELV